MTLTGCFTKMRFVFLLFLISLILSSAALAAPDQRGLVPAEKNRDSRKRVALVIGNSNYLSSPLKNPVNDAKAMAVTLRKLGFEVDERTDLGFIPFNEAVESFGTRLRTGGIGLFYYAGHGMQVNGANYLIPVDAKINTENEVRYKAIDSGLVLAKMESAKSDVNIAILDACRNNPFARSFRSASQGLAQMDAPTGTIIAYATSPGRTASDGDGKNGAYTEALIKAMESPGLKVEEVFKQVRKLVADKTAKVQIPWESSSLMGDFHFIQPSSMTEIQTTPLSSSPPSIRDNAQLTEWMPLDEYVSVFNKMYKEGKYTSNAEGRLTGSQIQQFRAEFRPIPKEMELFSSFVGMSTSWYEKRKAEYEGSGFKELFHNTFTGSSGELYHQACWIKMKAVVPAPEVQAISSSNAQAKNRAGGFTDPVTGMEFVNVPGGCFMMGDSFWKGSNDEKPVHEVCVSNFIIGKYEATHRQWQLVMEKNPSRFVICEGADCPVENVNWNDVQNYLSKINGQAVKRYRLPTEAEWEYACRSGGKNEKYCGGDDEDTLAWYDKNSGRGLFSDGLTKPIGTKQPNGLGIYDMSGNVWEWTSDCYSGNYYGESPRNNPQGPPCNDKRVRRGGSWDSTVWSSRAAFRGRAYPTDGINTGFRLVVSDY